MSLPPEPTDPREPSPTSAVPDAPARPGIDEPFDSPEPGIDEHAWISAPATASSKSQSRIGGWVVVGLILVLIALVLILARIAIDVANKIELPGSSSDSAAVDTVEGGESTSDFPVDEGAFPMQRDYLVGTDLEPGLYRLAKTYIGADRWDSCSWGLYSGGYIGDDSRISGDVYTGGRGAVTLSDGQMFSTYACGDWLAVDPAGMFQNPDDAADSFGNGAWLAGEDIRPGTYTMAEQFNPVDENDFCFYSVSDRWTDNPEAQYDAEFADAPAQFTVTVDTGLMVNSDNCGEWERLDG